MTIDLGEMMLEAVEQKLYEECSVAPGPGNDVIVAEVLVIWSESLITVLNVAGKEDWSITHSGFALLGLFKAVSAHSKVIVLLESDDVCTALLEGQDMERKNVGGAECVTSPQWREMLLEWRHKDIRGL
jgi:hypothetical protein